MWDFLFGLALEAVTWIPSRRWQLFLAALMGVFVAVLMIVGFVYFVRALH